MIEPMLSKNVDRLPASKDYVYEIKLDGQRTISEVSKTSMLLYTRSFQRVTDKYPELTELRKCIKGKSAILDGEIVAISDGIPSFQLLQQRMNLRPGSNLNKLAEDIPVLYYVFDLLALNGKPLLRTPLIERKALLLKALAPSDTIKIVPYFDSRDVTIEKAQEFGYEGVVAKKRDSFYCPGERSNLWLKQKFQETDSFVIAGWMEGGRSKNFGALLIAKYRGKQLQYVGRVGTGFNDRTISILMEEFEKIAAPKSRLLNNPNIPGKVHWLKPRLVTEVKFKQWTDGKFLRAPVYLGLRKELRPMDCKF